MASPLTNPTSPPVKIAIEMNRNAAPSPYCFGTMHIKTSLMGTVIFCACHTLLVALVLSAALVNGAVPLATTNVLQLVYLCSMIVSGFIAQYLAVVAFEEMSQLYLLPLFFWQCLLLMMLNTLLQYCISLTTFAYSLFVVIFLTFLMLILVCLIFVVICAFNFIEKQQKFAQSIEHDISCAKNYCK